MGMGTGAGKSTYSSVIHQISTPVHTIKGLNGDTSVHVNPTFDRRNLPNTRLC